MRDRRRIQCGTRSGCPAPAEVLSCVAIIAWLWGGASSGIAEETASVARVAARPERSVAARASAAMRVRELYRDAPSQWPPPHVDQGVLWSELGVLPPVEHPESNPFSREKVLLGRALFFDSRLSASGKLSCASCHDPDLAWADGRAVAQPPARQPGRNTPSIRNAAYRRTLFWDGRADTLEQQAEEALLNPLEMAASSAHVVGLISASSGYRDLFTAAFPEGGVTLSRAVQAIACFERTIVGGRSRFDAFLRGESQSLSDAEMLGLDLFRREARCMNCHHGPTFSDGRLHVLGLSFFGKSNEDLGRYGVSGDPADSGRFLTPSLRDVTHTGPLMHSGIFMLHGVLNMYNAGMARPRRNGLWKDDPLFPITSPHVKPLGLNRQDLSDLAAFLGSLEEPLDRDDRPRLPDAEPPIINAAR